jgi:hypothetical protein
MLGSRTTNIPQYAEPAVSFRLPCTLQGVVLDILGDPSDLQSQSAHARQGAHFGAVRARHPTSCSMLRAGGVNLLGKATFLASL